MRFVLDKEKQKAERRRVEGQGVADFQTIVSRGISEQLLRWKAIEVASEISKSQNAKIIGSEIKAVYRLFLNDK